MRSMLKRFSLTAAILALLVLLLLAVHRYQVLSDSRSADAPAVAALVARLDAEARTGGRVLSLAAFVAIASAVGLMRRLRGARIKGAVWIAVFGVAVAGVVGSAIPGQKIRRGADQGWTHEEALEVLRLTHVLFALTLLLLVAILVLVALYRNALISPTAAALRALIVALLLAPAIVHIFIARPDDTADVRETLSYAVRTAALRVDVAACLSPLLVVGLLRKRSEPALAELL